MSQAVTTARASLSARLARAVKTRFAANFAANGFGQSVTILVQLATVPLFVNVLGAAGYGGWLLLSAVPAYLAMSDAGYVMAASNRMAIEAETDAAALNVTFQSALGLVAGATCVALFVAAAVISRVDAGPLELVENKLALLALAASALAAMASGLNVGVFRASGANAEGVVWGNSCRLVEFLGTAVGLILGRSILWAAVGGLIGRLAGSTAWTVYAARRFRQLRWGLSQARTGVLIELARPALSFLAFPTANAFAIQGLTIAVGVYLGPTALAIFGAYRTLSRAVTQATALVCQAIWPQLSQLYAQRNWLGLRDTMRRGSIAIFLLSAAGCALLAAFGHVIMAAWTNGRIPFHLPLFVGYLLAPAITSLWQLKWVALMATNQHDRFALIYVVASLLPLALMAAVGGGAGPYGPVAGMLGFEIVMAVAAFGLFDRTFKGALR